MNLMELAGIKIEDMITEEQNTDGIYTLEVPYKMLDNFKNILKKNGAAVLRPYGTYNIYNNHYRKMYKEQAMVIKMNGEVPEELKAYISKGDNTKQKLSNSKWVELEPLKNSL